MGKSIKFIETITNYHYLSCNYAVYTENTTIVKSAIMRPSTDPRTHILSKSKVLTFSWQIFGAFAVLINHG